MIIGVPKEIKIDENRVSMTPAGANEFVKMGHRVLIERNAGIGSGFQDSEYEMAGAEVANNAPDIFDNAQMIIKVKEPQPNEIEMLCDGQILYTFLHLAPDRELTKGLLNKKIVGIAYETIEAGGKLVCLEPMSEIAGKISAIMGTYYLAKPYGGNGILAGGVAGVHSANFLIIGGGTAGLNAAKVAAGLGARVVVLDIDLERMRYLEDVLPKNCEMVMSNKTSIEYEIANTDVIIGSVLIPGAKTPKLITKDMLKLITKDMLKLIKPGSVIVDVSIDQGGCVETARPTTHSHPVYEINGIVHYCVANMPGAYPRTSTFALTNATLPYGLLIANDGWKKAARQCKPIAQGINIVEGKVTCKPVAEAFEMQCISLSDLL